MLHLIKQHGLEGRITVESAGTGDYHVGERPDRRSSQAAQRRGVTLPSRAQQFVRADLDRFDYVLAMDTNNLKNLQSLGGGAHVRLLRDFDPASPPGSSVPDPYYGGERGFEEVLDQCFAACQGLLHHLRAQHNL